MQVTDLKAILDYEHNEQWLAALNCYKGIWDHNPTDDVAIRYCFFCWYLIWQWEQIDFPGEDISFEAKITVDNRMGISKAELEHMPYSSGRGVTFPYVGIYDTYNNEETTNYICYVAYMRYDIDDSSRSLMYAGTKMTYGRAILVQDENGGYSCEAFELLGDGEGWSEKLREYCGPLTELPSAIMDGSINYSSTFPDDMCEQYCILADAIVKE